MGRTKNNLISGRAGNVIFYEYRGKPCCRSIPDSVKQTAGMKKSASQFGWAARLSRYFRHPLTAFFPDAKDKNMLYGFNSALLKWMRELKPDENTYSINNFFIDRFQFNEAALLPVLVTQPIHTRFSGSGEIFIDIPELAPGKNILAPANTIQLHWWARVTSVILDFDMQDCYQVNLQADDKRRADTVVKYGAGTLPPLSLSLHLQQVPGALTIVALRLQYEVKKGNNTQIVTDKRWQPAGVVGSCFGVEQNLPKF